MAKVDSIHASFILAAEFREKIQRTKEEFGATGNFFSCELLRGVYDFPVKELAYFQNAHIDTYDVLLIRGRAVMRTDRLILEPTDFVVAESPELIKQAEQYIEAGRIFGDGRVQRKPYPDKVNGGEVPQVEISFYGYHDMIKDDVLFKSLPKDCSTVPAHYQAKLSLDVQYIRQESGLSRRNRWLVYDQQIEVIKPQAVRREKSEN